MFGKRCLLLARRTRVCRRGHSVFCSCLPPPFALAPHSLPLPFICPCECGEECRLCCACLDSLTFIGIHSLAYMHPRVSSCHTHAHLSCLTHTCVSSHTPTHVSSHTPTHISWHTPTHVSWHAYTCIMKTSRKEDKRCER